MHLQRVFQQQTCTASSDCFRLVTEVSLSVQILSTKKIQLNKNSHYSEKGYLNIPLFIGPGLDSMSPADSKRQTMSSRTVRHAIGARLSKQQLSDKKGPAAEKLMCCLSRAKKGQEEDDEGKRDSVREQLKWPILACHSSIEIIATPSELSLWVVRVRCYYNQLLL